MKKIIILSILTCFLCSCGFRYYGYAPGTDYKILKPLGDINLRSKAYAIEFLDARGTKSKIDCSDSTLDRGTELEGTIGMGLLRESINQMIQNSNGKIDVAGANKITVELQGLSYKPLGMVHGYVQFNVTSPALNRTYCSDMSESDPDAPFTWATLAVRKTTTRLIVSASMRRAVETFVRDLASAAD